MAPRSIVRVLSRDAYRSDLAPYWRELSNRQHRMLRRASAKQARRASVTLISEALAPSTYVYPTWFRVRSRELPMIGRQSYTGASFYSQCQEG